MDLLTHLERRPWASPFQGNARRRQVKLISLGLGPVKSISLGDAVRSGLTQRWPSTPRSRIDSLPLIGTKGEHKS